MSGAQPGGGRKLFFTPQEYFAGLLHDIDHARQEIKMESYIFELDQTGESVLCALEKAIARGVSLKLLIDGVGSYRDAGQIAQRLRSANSEVRVFHPLPWDFALYRRALYAGRWYSRFFHFVASINHRNHRKLCLIDEQIAWLGSYNITSDHANPLSPEVDDYWHDTGLRASGTLAQSLTDNFDSVWERKIDSPGVRSRRFLAGESFDQRRRSRMQLLKVLESATRRICITNAYFNPSGQLLKVLERKAGEGVSVRLIVPARSDVVFFPTLSRSYYADLLQAGVQVYEYGRRVLHSKTMVIDDRLLVGSTNLNYRSLFHDLELDLICSDEDLVTLMEQRFSEDICASDEITLSDWQRHPWLLKMLGLLSRFLRYWL